MKAQILMVMLLFSLVISSAFAQRSNPDKTSLIPDHPLVKTLKLLDNGWNQPQALKSINENFQLNEIEVQGWADGEWRPQLKTEHTYQSGNRVESRGYFLPVPDGTWELSSKNIFTFENNYLTSITQQGISEGVPVSQEKSLYTYQQIAGQTFIQSVEYQTWNSSENEWTNEDRSTITVENGMLSEVLEEVWMNDQWELYERYTYEETGGDVVETTQMYDSSLEDWVNYEQYVYLDLTSPELYDRLIEFIDYVEDGRSFVVL